MILTEDCTLQQDLERAAASAMIDWECFRGKNILVTGATGLIGSQTVQVLVMANHMHDLGLTVYALVRNQKKAEAMLCTCLGKGLEIVSCDLLKPVQLDVPVDYILHGAGVTTSRDFVEKPVETIMTTLKGTENMLELAKEKKVSGMVYLSSMEAYGVVDAEHYIVRETDYGYIDPLQVRSSYSESKRMAEGICGAYAHEYQVPVKTARLAQTFGAGAPETENRVFAQFAKSILRGEDIVLHTDGSKAHCYCYTADAILGLLTVLLKGNSGEAYNISNESTFGTIRGMAEMLTEKYPESGSKLIFDIPEDANKYGYAPTSRMLVNAEKLTALGWSPEISLESMFERLIASMKQMWKEFR
ncbi:MAG: NAD-dependent epimerase/dehydratase family protein [Clostridiales bacterium]|nr:NAD-dependent epimerase/dehydratase family protein [Candidatus Blautia equi]